MRAQPLGRMRRRLALFICPELGAETHQNALREVYFYGEPSGRRFRFKSEERLSQEMRPGRVPSRVSQRSAGPCRSGSRPDPRDQGVLRRLRGAVDRLENSLAGDTIGVIALVVCLIAGLWIGQGLGGR